MPNRPTSSGGPRCRVCSSPLSWSRTTSCDWEKSSGPSLHLYIIRTRLRRRQARRRSKNPAAAAPVPTIITARTATLMLGSYTVSKFTAAPFPGCITSSPSPEPPQTTPDKHIFPLSSSCHASRFIFLLPLCSDLLPLYLLFHLLSIFILLVFFVTIVILCFVFVSLCFFIDLRLHIKFEKLEGKREREGQQGRYHLEVEKGRMIRERKTRVFDELKERM